MLLNYRAAHLFNVKEQLAWKGLNITNMNKATFLINQTEKQTQRLLSLWFS